MMDLMDDSERQRDSRFRYERRSRSPKRRDSFGRDIVYTRGERRRNYRSSSRSVSPAKGSTYQGRSPSTERNQPPSSQTSADVYIPNYSRDGYTPAARYGDDQQGKALRLQDNQDTDLRRPRRRNMDAEVNEDAMRSIPPYGESLFPQPANWSHSSILLHPDKCDFLLTYQQFVQFHKESNGKGGKEDHQSSEGDADLQKVDDKVNLENLYKEYTQNFQFKQFSQFFEMYKDHCWMQEKYEPARIIKQKERVSKMKQHLFNLALEDIKSGKWDSISFDEENDVVVEKEDIEIEANVKEQFESPSVQPILFIRAIPPNIKFEDVEEVCKRVEGFENLVFSEPNPLKRFHRVGWVIFTKGTDLEETLTKIDKTRVGEFELHLMPYRKLSTTRVKLAPDVCSSIARMQSDLEMVKKLTVKLDSDNGITDENNKAGGESIITQRLNEILPKLFATAEQGEKEEGEATDAHNELSAKEIIELHKTLDFHIEYLRRVHLLDYYSGGMADSEEEFSRKFPYVFKRKKLSVASGFNNAKNWTKSLDLKYEQLLKSDKELEESIETFGGKKIQSILDAKIGNEISKVDEGKYRCKKCSKLFKGEEYVRKHINAKHSEDLQKLRSEAEYFYQYLKDPFRLFLPSTGYAMPPMSSNFGTNTGTMAPPRFIPPPIPFQTAPGMIPRIGFMDSHLFPSRPFQLPSGPGPVRHTRRSHYSSMTRPRAGSGSGGRFNPYSRPPSNVRPDPRELRSYVDLDAPAEKDMEIKYD